MIQFNLLPDIKIEYIKVRRTKRIIMIVAGGSAALCITIFLMLLLVVSVFQQKHLRDLSKDIKTSSQKLQDTKDLNKILTIQNQLNSLPGLHNAKPVASRLFGYLGQITPVQVSVAKLNIDYVQHTMTFDGATDSIGTVNKFIDTMKFTTYQTKDSQDASNGKNAFSDVVLSSFTLGSSQKSSVTYQIALKFDPVIFDSSKEVSLVVPKTVTTRSETEKPTDLFQSTGTNTGGR